MFSSWLDSIFIKLYNTIIKYNMEKEVTNNEILEAMNEFANNVDKRFDGIDGRLDGIDKRLIKVEATMVDKDYLDSKLADLRGDIVVIVRNEDMKVMK